MNAPGKTMLKVTSIILIVLGSLGMLGLACKGGVALLMDTIPLEELPGQFLQSALLERIPKPVAAAWDLVASSMKAVFIIKTIVGAAVCLLELMFGIIGVRNCGKPEKGAFFTGAGAALLALMAVYLLLSFSPITLLSLVLPILFIVGAMINNSAMRASGPAEPEK